MSFDSPFLSSLWWPRAKAAGVETLGKGCSLPAPAREASWASRGPPSAVRRSVLSVFVPLSESLRQWGTFGSTKAPPRLQTREAAGAAREGRGDSVGREGAPVPRKGRPDGHPGEAREGIGVLRGGGVRGAFYFSACARSWPGAAAILWRGRHFAGPRGQGGRGGARAAAARGGRGWRRHPGGPQPLRRARLLCSSPLGSGGAAPEPR